MDNLLESLSGIERVKYLKTLIEKVNNISSKYASNNHHTQPAKEEFESCSACASKTKRFLLACSRNSDKIDLKRIKPVSQKCDIHRLKFVKHQNSYSKNTAPSVSKCEVKTHHREQQKIEIKTFEAARDASFEAEKRYLREIYSRKPTNDIDNQQKQKLTKNVEIKKGYVKDETETDRTTFCKIHSAKVDPQENVSPIPEPNRPTINIVQPQQSEPEFPISIESDRGTSLTGDDSVVRKNRTVAVTNAQQTIADQHISLNSDGTRRIAGQPCAHCQRAISDVAFFNGNRQLCIDCADSHFRSVTRARLTNRPMSYREFKIVGGDTLYSKLN